MAIWQLIGLQFAYAWIASSITKNKRSSLYPPGGESGRRDGNKEGRGAKEF